MQGNQFDKISDFRLKSTVFKHVYYNSGKIFFTNRKSFKSIYTRKILPTRNLKLTAGDDTELEIENSLAKDLNEEINDKNAIIE